ncbi:22557_t:CDS:1, partial [Gigaspora rosea]
MNEERTKFTIQGLYNKEIHTVIRSAIWSPMPFGRYLQVNDLCEYFQNEDGGWYESR